MTSFRLGGVLLAAVTLFSTVSAGTATADHRPSSRLSLTVEGPRGASTTVRLECRPAGGSHPTPRSACREIARAGGDFESLPGSPEMIACTMEYRPVTASARAGTASGFAGSASTPTRARCSPRPAWSSTSRSTRRGHAQWEVIEPFMPRVPGTFSAVQAYCQAEGIEHRFRCGIAWRDPAAAVDPRGCGESQKPPTRVS